MFTFVRSIEVVVMIVLGGLGSITGSVLSAVVLTLGLEALREFQAYRMVVYAALLIALMLLRPQGIFGTHELWDLKLFKRRTAPKAAAGKPGPGGVS
jgi:branched-chain amino acid transport system permease protein